MSNLVASQESGLWLGDTLEYATGKGLQSICTKDLAFIVLEIQVYLRLVKLQPSQNCRSESGQPQVKENRESHDKRWEM